MELRGECQESMYNLGRALHQMGLTHLAIHYYQKALTIPAPKLEVSTHTSANSFFIHSCVLALVLLCHCDFKFRNTSPSLVSRTLMNGPVFQFKQPDNSFSSFFAHRSLTTRLPCRACRTIRWICRGRSPSTSPSSTRPAGTWGWPGSSSTHTVSFEKMQTHDL